MLEVWLYCVKVRISKRARQVGSACSPLGLFYSGSSAPVNAKTLLPDFCHFPSVFLYK